MRAVKAMAAVACAWGAAVAGARAATAACTVDVTAAPPAAHAAIARWVAGEPSCRPGLVVRVVALDDGSLALTATDADGTVRDRIVPDAEAAAALVVSWIADDQAAAGDADTDDTADADDSTDAAAPVAAPITPPPQGPVPAVAAAPTAPPSPAVAPIAAADDTEADAEVPDPLVDKLSRALRTPRRSFAIGGSTDRGVRLQLDVVKRSHWVLGLAGALHPSDETIERVERSGMSTEGLRRDLTLYAGTNIRLGPLRVRVQFGFGVDDLALSLGTTTMHHHVATHTELAVLAALPVAYGWGVVGGPVVVRALGGGAGDDVALASNRTMFFGLEHGL